MEGGAVPVIRVRGHARLLKRRGGGGEDKGLFLDEGASFF